MPRELLIKNLIELSQTVLDADAVVSKYTDIEGFCQKAKYIEKLFGVSVVSRCVGNSSDDQALHKNDYYALLAAVIDDAQR